MSSCFDAGLARDWLASCLSSHKCHAAISSFSKITPSRLIEIKSTGGDLTTRLIDYSGATCFGYAALTYRWPKNEAHVTVTHNIQARLSSIPPHSLPATILDAVRITNALGLHYLWVDSLCIAQDSRSEWEVECTKMASIYANAIVTLAASGTTGMMRDSTSYPLPNACTLEYYDCERLPVGGLKVRFAGSQLINEAEVSGRHFAPNSSRRENRPPLETRAWTLQEQLLSSRVLLFDQDKRQKMRWRCAGGRRMESLHGWLENDPSSYAMGFEKDLALNQPQAQMAGHLYSLWQRVLDDLWQRDLTYPMDLLPALSGVAGMIQRLTGDTYLAGLWQNDLPRCLAWKAEGFRDPQQPNLQTKLTPYRGPSWSWARSDISEVFLKFHGGAMEGQVTTYMKFISAQARAEGKDPFGRVSLDCLLTIEAPAHTVKIRPVRTRSRTERWALASADTGTVYFPYLCLEPDDPYFPASLSQDPKVMDFLVVLISKSAHRFAGDNGLSTALLLSSTAKGSCRRVAILSINNHGRTKAEDVDPFFAAAQRSTVTIE